MNMQHLHNSVLQGLRLLNEEQPNPNWQQTCQYIADALYEFYELQLPINLVHNMLLECGWFPWEPLLPQHVGRLVTKNVPFMNGICGY